MAEGFFMNGRDVLIYLSLKYHGDWSQMVQAIKSKETLSPSEVAEALCQVASQTVTILDPTYPESWKAAVRPPLVVYYYGNLELVRNESECIAYVGSREASSYGRQMARLLAGGLAKEGYVIVSGLARGIDAEATAAALDCGGKAVGVLGSGISLVYPESSRSLYERLKLSGLVLSEYPLLTPPEKEHFPSRNRIIAATSKGLIVGEASKKSGTLITVGYALGLNKEIGCVPYPSDADSACNMLIKEGASMIEDLSDANLMLGYMPPKGTS
jgi:DNA processing protein